MKYKYIAKLKEKREGHRGIKSNNFNNIKDFIERELRDFEHSERKKMIIDLEKD